MWVYVVLNFPERTKVGRLARTGFYRVLEKDGFKMVTRNLYVRYCSTQTNAVKHKARIQEHIFEKYAVSIILVADKQNESSYHYLGRRKTKKTRENPLKLPEMIEFF